MAFGFPSSFFQYIPYIHLSKEQFLFYSIKSCQKLDWIILDINNKELIAETHSKRRNWNEKITISFENEDGYILSTSNGNQIYDRGRNLKNTDTFFEVFNDLKKEKPVSDLDPDGMFEFINAEKEKAKHSITEEKNINSFYSFLSPFIIAKDYFVTPIIIYVNIFIFLIMFISGVNFFFPETSDIIKWGGNYNLLTVENQWWRLVSCFFIHIGFQHVLINSISLAYVGLLLESYLSRAGFLICYLFCGILASITSLYWHDKVISAGASGAIFGMYGILITVISTRTINRKLSSNTISIILIFTVLSIFNSFKDGIDGAAHFGGLIAGIVFGIILSIFNHKKEIAFIIISALSLILIPILVTNVKSKNIYIYQLFEYETKMQEFADMEKMALEAYNVYVTDKESKEELLYMIESRGIYYWQENIKLIKKVDLLYLPKETHIQNKNLIKYCELRIKLYQLAYKKIDQNTTAYDNELDSLNYQIVELLQNLKKE